MYEGVKFVAVVQTTLGCGPSSNFVLTAPLAVPSMLYMIRF